MTASFARQELLANLAELETLARKHGGAPRLAAAPSDQLSIDLAAILTSERSRSAPQPATVEEAARLADNATPSHAAPSRSRWPLAAAPALVIALSSLLGVAGFDAWSRGAVVTPQAPLAPPGPSETAAGRPSAEGTAKSLPVAAEPAAIAQPAAAKTLAAIDPPAPVATSAKPEAPAAEITKPEKRPSEAAAEERHARKSGTARQAKFKPSPIAKPREARREAVTPDKANTEPAIVSDARRVTQTISGVFNSWPGADRQAVR